MNPQSTPGLKNVTPAPAAVAIANPRALLVPAIAIGVLVLVLFGVFVLGFHRGNRYEGIANDVTRAIANNDMTPVAGDFNAIRRPELADRGRVGKLSDMVVALGAFKGSTEITPAGSPVGFHEFTETFASGTLDEKYELDADGKIVKFHIGPPPTP